MGAPHPADFLEVMNRRSDLLALLGDGPRTKRDLVAELDVSRSTVDRGIRELAAKDLVERTDDGYRQTLTGRIALQDYRTFTCRIETLCEGSELLADLDPDVDLSPVFLDGADIVESDLASPHRPLEELYGYVESASHVRGFAPAVHPQQVETYQEAVAERGLGAELVLTDEAIDRLLTEYQDAFEVGLEPDRVSFYRTDEPLPYSLTVADLPDRTVAAVMLYGDGGIHGVVLNDDPRAVAWAESRFEAELADADPVQ